MSMQDDINQAELNKLNEEIALLKSERENLEASTEKTKKEKEEIEQRLKTRLFSSRTLLQVFITAITAVPIMWGYFNTVIDPLWERDKVRLEISKDSLEFAKIKYEKTLKITKDSLKRANNNLDVMRKDFAQVENDFESNKKDFEQQIKKLQEDHAACLASDPQLKEELNQQLQDVKENLKFGLLGSYKIGFYYLSGQEELAEELRQHLVAQGFVGETQLYEKDDAFFSRVGIPNGYEIRYEAAYEKNSAKKLQVLMQTNEDREFSLRAVKSRTQSFISVFIHQ